MVYKTKVDLVYEELLEKLTNGIYKPGEKLIINHISKENGISDIPVREAIRRLESEGYVKILPNQGAVVYDSTPESINEIFGIKAVLEGYATRLAMDELGKEDYAELHRINSELQAAIEKGEAKLRGELNTEFHHAIYNACGSQELKNMIETFWRKYKITKMVLTALPGRSKSSVKEHEEILAFMETGDYDKAEKAMRNHTLRSGGEVNSCIK